MEIIVISSLEKVFKTDELKAKEIKSLSMFKNENLSFQIAIKSENDTKATLSFDRVSGVEINIYYVQDVPVKLASFPDSDDYFIKKEPGNYPDILIKTNQAEIKKNEWNCFWVEIVGNFRKSGIMNLDFRVNEVSTSINIEVLDAKLPKQELIYTNWFHADCICDYYGIEAFSNEFWIAVKNFVSVATKHGMNCILTPLFTPALDTQIGGERTTMQLVKVKRSGGHYFFDLKNLKKWVNLCKEEGIEYFEMSHFFTQWGAKHSPKIIATDHKGREKKIFGWETRTSSKEYEKFLCQFSVVLKKFIYENKLENNVFFHISDEPSKRHLKVYKKRAELIKRIFGEFKIIDALSNYEFYKSGAVNIPIPCENEAEEFFGKVEHFWVYYCCGQHTEYVPNRFIAMPSERNRVLGFLLYKYDVEGFLQWGYNFYNSCLSKEHIDPYNVTDAGGYFPSGDAFVVYPGEKFEVHPSLRLKVFYDAIQDLRSLKLLESKIGKEKVLSVLDNITFKEYPHSSQWLLETREKINSEFRQ